MAAPEVSRIDAQVALSHPHHRDLSDEEKTQIKENLRRTMAPHVAEFVKANVELDHREAAAKASLEQLGTRKAELDSRKGQLDAKKAPHEQRLKENRAATFYQIFYGLKSVIPAEKIDEVYQKYMADNPVTTIDMESASGTTAVFRLTSMKGVVQYLTDHPEIKQLDFRTFKGEIGDMKTLTEYLALNNCSIRAIALKECLSVADKEAFKTAATVRQGALQVKYFA